MPKRSENRDRDRAEKVRETHSDGDEKLYHRFLPKLLHRVSGFVPSYHS